MKPRPGGAALAYFGMLLLLLMAAVSFSGGNPKAGGVMIALAALCFAGGSFLRRGE